MKALKLLGTLLILSLAWACASADPPRPAATQPSGQDPSPTEAVESIPLEPSEDPSIILTAWRQGPHANTFVQTVDGTNSACARCHAPVNWIPTLEDMPESCLTCKFEVDPPPPFIAEDEWTHVECKVCHLTKKDEVSAEVAWLEIAPIEEYAEVATISELCDKCHLADTIPDHGAVRVTGAHAGYQCTDCHNAHDGQASCTSSGCHEHALASETPGHDAEHAQVACEACHDDGSMIVSPAEDTGIWSTSIMQGSGRSVAQVSHAIVVEAPCDRCHAAGNQWQLNEVDEP